MSSRQYLKEFRNKQQIKDDQINYLLADAEKNLEEYRNTIEQKERQLYKAKKITISAKKTYDITLKENKELKNYIFSLKDHIQKQQSLLIKNQNKNKFKKVISEEESEYEPDSEPEESENEEIETKKQKLKKESSKKRNYIFDYINQKDVKRHKR